MKSVWNNMQLARIPFKGHARLLLAVLVAGFALGGGRVPIAQAMTFTVNSTADAVDANPGDGVCATAGGACTLRAAVMETNAQPGADTINLPKGTYILSGAANEDAAATGDLDVTDKTGSLTILGDGAATTIIDGGGTDRVFQLACCIGTQLEVSGVTIQNGSAGSGGGVSMAGGALILNNTTVRGNTVTSGGGGIASSGGSIIITSSIVTGNTGGSGGGGISAAFRTVLVISESTISDNSASAAGGILNAFELTLINSTVSGNTATAEHGGGIWGRDIGSTMTITNSTISGNSANFGGGIANRGAMTLTNSTVAGNAATTLGNSIFHNNFFDITVLKNTIIADGIFGDDCATALGTIMSSGHNLDSDGSCGLDQPSDLPSTDPLIGSLQDNGGPTLTHALLPGSPAIDAVPIADCTLATDQRGVARPQGAACDIGAFELEMILAVQVTIDIKPGSDTNPINPKSKGIIPVAILTTDDLDATTVDPLSVQFGPGGVTKAHGKAHIQDADGDGDLDLVLHFKTQDTGIQCGDTEASLTGETFGRQIIEGTDFINAVGCN